MVDQYNETEMAGTFFFFFKIKKNILKERMEKKLNL